MLAACVDFGGVEGRCDGLVELLGRALPRGDMLRLLPCGGVAVPLDERWLPDGGREPRGIIDAFDPDASMRPTEARMACGPFAGAPAPFRYDGAAAGAAAAGAVDSFR